MKEIQLTQGQVALVDDWNYEELNKYKWQAKWNEHTKSYYAARGIGNPQKTKRMHCEIMKTPKGMFCDHINHNTLDNREENLRNATRSQNGMNRRVNRNNKLGEKCISPHRYGFVVIIYKDGKCVFNKKFNTLDQAIHARNNAINQHHGEFANYG